jgi:nitrate/nitrite-specific signal transduction histidine kinase
MSSVANESYDLVRGTLAILQPNRSSHLHELFENHAQQIIERTGMEIEINCHGEPRQISARQMRQLFFVFREALSNIEKHANASRVIVETNWLNQEMTLTVTDDGQGFDTGRALAGNHYGLKFMRDRIEQLHGQFDVWSKPGEGARLAVCFPYEEEMSFLPVSKSVHEHRIL